MFRIVLFLFDEIFRAEEIKMIDENKLLNDFLEYCKELIGNEEWDKRFESCKKFYFEIKSKPIILESKDNETGITFISPEVVSKDIPMWYFFNVYNYINNPLLCDLGLIARIVPKLLRVSQWLPQMSLQNGFSRKMIEALNKNNTNIENFLFEILVACTYLRNGADRIEFLFDKSRRMADFKANFNGEIYIECKRKSKESNYSKVEREAWYKQYLPVQEYLNDRHLSLVIKVTFHDEIINYPSNYLYSIIVNEIDRGATILRDDDKITIEVYKPDFNSVNSEINSKWKIYSPKLTKKLFKRESDLYGVTGSLKSEKHNILTDYVENITEACAGLWYCDSSDALTKKSMSFKRHICDAIDQIPNDKIGSIHICYESNDGNIVEEQNFSRTLDDLKTLKINNKKIGFIYIHNLRLMLPEDKNWDVEETVLPISNRNVNSKQLLQYPHIITY